MLDAFMLDKALYELLYELNNRPAWVRIPLQGVAALIPPEEVVTRLTDLDIYLLAEGTDDRSYDKLGAHPTTIDGVCRRPLRGLGPQRSKSVSCHRRLQRLERQSLADGLARPLGLLGAVRDADQAR